MPDERRDNQRTHVAGVKVVYESVSGERVETDAVDLSPGGVFIRTASPLPVGKRITLDIQVVGEPAPWPAIGRVVWARDAEEGADKPAGMGVKLIGTDETVVAALDRMLATREPTTPGVGQSSAPPPPMPATTATAGALSLNASALREREPTLVGVGTPSSPPPAETPAEAAPDVPSPPVPPAPPVPAFETAGPPETKSAAMDVPPALPPPLAHVPARRTGGGRGVVLLLLVAIVTIATYVLLDGFLKPTR